MSNKNFDKDKKAIVEKIFADPELTKKLFKDFGFDDKDYTDEEKACIMYSITECGGLTDQVKAAKALYIVSTIARYACEVADSYEKLGTFTYDLLEECKVIKKNEQENTK